MSAKALFLVMYGYYDDWEIDSIWDDEDKAKARIEELSLRGDNHWDIETFALNRTPDYCTGGCACRYKKDPDSKDPYKMLIERAENCLVCPGGCKEWEAPHEEL